MTVIPQLAHSMGRRNEVPNQELAKKLAARNDKAAVRELVISLQHPIKGIQHDCIKVLYEIGRIKPSMINGLLPEFLALLGSANNRMQWGAMCAIDSITSTCADQVYAALPQIIDAADKGSVITRDHAVAVLIKLAAVPKFFDDAFELLLAQLRTCPGNQLPMYAEGIMPVVAKKSQATLVATLRQRLPEMQTAAKRKRIELVIKKISAA